MNFKILDGNGFTIPVTSSAQLMVDLVSAIASHRLCNLFFPNGVPNMAKIHVSRHGKDIWISSNRAVIEQNQKTGDVKIIFYPDIYRYELKMKRDDINLVAALDRFADTLDKTEHVVVDFACRFVDVCSLKKNKEIFSIDFDIVFDISDPEMIRCNIENGCAMAGTSFECSLNDLKTKDAQEVFDTIDYAYEDDEL